MDLQAMSLDLISTYQAFLAHNPWLMKAFVWFIWGSAIVDI